MELQSLSVSGFVNVDCILFGGHTIAQTKEKNLIDEGRITFIHHVYFEIMIPGL
jgi:hypothetical protein